MDIGIIFILVLLVIGVTFVVVSVLRNDVECEAPKIIYRYVPENTLDIQFGKDNYPSEIHADMFAKGSPWIGGYELGNGKTYIAEEKKK
jgi:hypothetical protein